jgi:hypothetical protein
MKKFIYPFIFVMMLCMASCDQYISRKFGGNTTINLQPGEKLVEVTWKNEADLWYLVEPMDSNYVPKTKVFKESSNLGVLSGSITFVESR